MPSDGSRIRSAAPAVVGGIAGFAVSWAAGGGLPWSLAAGLSTGLVAGLYARLRTLSAILEEGRTVSPDRPTSPAADPVVPPAASRGANHLDRDYRRLVETSNDLIWSVDAEGRWLFLNEKATLRIYGRHPAEMLGRHFRDFLAPEQVARDLETFEVVKGGSPVERYETIHLRKDNSRVRLLFNAVTMLDEQGRVTGATGTATDVTERYELEERRRELERRVQESLRAESLSVVAGGVAHDFNNLLMAMLGNAQLARAGLEKGHSAIAHLDVLDHAIGQASELVQQLMAYTGDLRSEMAAVDLGKTIRSAIETLDPRRFSEPAVDLKVELDPGLEPVRGDEVQIRRVVQNLVINALEASRDERRIRVRSGSLAASKAALAKLILGDRLEAGSYAYFEVQDKGVGMDPATLARIFDPFFTTKFAGRGLGLAAAQGIVGAHGGAIDVESSPGRGTRFRVLLPFAQDKVADVAAESVGRA